MCQTIQLSVPIAFEADLQVVSGDICVLFSDKNKKIKYQYSVLNVILVAYLLGLQSSPLKHFWKIKRQAWSSM